MPPLFASTYYYYYYYYSLLLLAAISRKKHEHMCMCMSFYAMHSCDEVADTASVCRRNYTDTRKRQRLSSSDKITILPLTQESYMSPRAK